MAKASAQITLHYIIDIQATYRYYLLQSSTAAKPSKPTTYPPPEAWDDVEPTYTSGSTNSLYFVDCTIFTNNSFHYSEVSKSTSYEAAKEAYNKAQNAQNAATNAQNAAQNAQDSVDNLKIGGRNLLRYTEKLPVTGDLETGIDQFTDKEYVSGSVITIPNVASSGQDLEVKVASKNLIDMPNLTKYSGSSIPSWEGDVLKVTQTQPTSTYFSANYIIPVTKDLIGKKITVSAKAKSSTGAEQAAIRLTYFYGNGYLQGTSSLIATTYSTEFTTISKSGIIQELPSDKTGYLCIALYSNAGGNVTNGATSYYKDIQIEYGDTATNYTPYIPDLTNLSGLGKNLFPVTEQANYNGVTLSKYEDYYVLNGTATDSGNFTTIIDYLPAGTYTLCANNPIPSGSHSAIIQIYSSITQENIYVYDGTEYAKTTKTINGGEQYQARIRIERGITYDNFIIKPQLEIGTFATAYEPYNTPVKVKVAGKNLVNFPLTSTTYNKWENGRTWGFSDDVDISHLRGETITYQTYIDLTNIDENNAPNYSSLYGCVMIWFINPDESVISAYGGNDIIGFGNAGISKKTVEVPDIEGVKVRLGVRCSFYGYDQTLAIGEDHILYYNPMVELGTTATEYEPYVEPQIGYADKDSNITGLKSVSPTTTLYSDIDGVLITCTNKTAIASTNEGLKFVVPGNSQAGMSIPLASDGVIQNGEKFILSFDYRGNLSNVDNAYLLQRTEPNVGFNIGLQPPTSETEWQHYSCPLTMDNDKETIEVFDISRATNYDSIVFDKTNNVITISSTGEHITKETLGELCPNLKVGDVATFTWFADDLRDITLDFKNQISYSENDGNYHRQYLITEQNLDYELCIAGFTGTIENFSITVERDKDRTCYALTLFYVEEGSCASEWIEIRNGSLKLEKGDKETDWSPAPEDNASVDDINTVTKTIKEYSTEISKTTSEIALSVSSLETTTKSSIEGINDNISTLQNQVDLIMKDDSLTIEIQKIKDDGVTKVDTGTGFVFDENGMTVDKTGAETNTKITENGMTVNRYDGNGGSDTVLKANKDGVDAKNLHAKTFLIINGTSRFEKIPGSNRVGCFWIGG